MFKEVIIALLAIGLYQGYRHFNQQELSEVAGVHDEVIMYSLTTCNYCKAKALDLKTAGIDFTEYYIDKDTKRRDELNQKLESADLPPRSYGTPILDVHGTVLPNNPSMASIRKYMNEN